MTNRRCPNCGRENPAEGRFCLYCGAALPVTAASTGAAPPPRRRADPPAAPQRASAQATSGAQPGRRARAPVQEVSTMLRGDSSGEVSEDLSAGQIVIITARWVLILAGLIFALAPPFPNNLVQLEVNVVVIIVLAMANFFLHMQVLGKRPTLDTLVYASAAVDIAVISVIILTQVALQGAAAGFTSTIYVFYFPALLAISVAFPRSMTILYTGATMAIYAMIALPGSGGDGAVILARLLMMGAVAFVGTRYLGVEGERRRAAAQAQQELLAQVRQRQA